MNIECKPKCSWAGLAGIVLHNENVHMAKRPHHLRDWRKHRKMTLEQVAGEVGMTHGNLSKIERGQVPYSEDLLSALAELYECDPGELLMRDPKDTEVIWTIWENAGAGDKDAIIEIAKTIVKRNEKAA